MADPAEALTSKFYNQGGWHVHEAHTEDARRWEDLRAHAQTYVRNCRLRVLRHLPTSGDRLLDMASGPIQYEEYLRYSDHFQQRYCVDLSAEALVCAKERLGDRGVYCCGSFFDIDLAPNHFDAAISLHTIYHMGADRQEAAVRKLIHVVKPGCPVVIVYSNPRTLIARIQSLWIFRQRLRRRRSAAVHDGPYFHAHPLSWWSRFDDVADVEMYPWRSLDSAHQKRLVPDNRFGAALLRLLFRLEDRHPAFFVHHFQYPMMVLTKK